MDLEVERLAQPRVHDRAVAAAADEEAAHLLEWPLGRRESDALQGLARGVVEALQGQSEVRAALGLRHRVDLVDDHPLGARQHLARA